MRLRWFRCKQISNMASSYSERDLSLVPQLTFTDVEDYIKKHKYSSGSKSLNKRYKYFSEGYLCDITVCPTEKGCKVLGKCYRSQKKSEAPYHIQTEIEAVDGNLVIHNVKCDCAIQLSSCCGHITGMLYQLASFKQLGLKVIPEDVAKTSQPQTWHIPRGAKITGKPIQDLEVRGYSDSTATTSHRPKPIKSTMYNPIRSEHVDWNAAHDKIAEVAPDILVLPALKDFNINNQVVTKFGPVPKGSLLSYQQREHEECIINITDGVVFPDLPAKNVIKQNFSFVLSANDSIKLAGLMLNPNEVKKFEEKTRDQNNSELWHKIRAHRITGSNIGRIYKRRKDEESLAKQLHSTRRVTTAAMRHGLTNEPVAAKAYAQAMNNNVNLYPCGIVVNIWSPWIGASPDRKVYKPNRLPPFGLLEIKCPVVVSVLEAECLTKGIDGTLRLKKTHNYYYQILTQMAVCGLEWCDLFVWCTHDHHIETVYFNEDVWDSVKDKIDVFFFSYFI